MLNKMDQFCFCDIFLLIEKVYQETEPNCFCTWIEYFQVHGVLNAVSWGTLMPLGAMIARYLKVFKSADPAWFYLHIACQTSAYIVGVAGWATGIKLGSDSPSVTYSTHRNIGIVLFALGTLQVPPLCRSCSLIHSLMGCDY